MIDYDAISSTVKQKLCENLPDDGMSKLAEVITNASVDASVAVLKEYEKQRSTNSGN